MTYDVRISRQALRSLEAIEHRDRQRIRAAIDLLAENPRPPACIALRGIRGGYRVRVGDYRIIYEIVDELLVVQVVAVGHRRDIYR